ncbi:MAG TPA: hypothetical protein DEB05_03135, partial [Firmicutes bacterium]|nr:hypothetical protein [Bacillota bacterium]
NTSQTLYIVLGFFLIVTTQKALEMKKIQKLIPFGMNFFPHPFNSRKKKDLMFCPLKLKVLI